MLLLRLVIERMKEIEDKIKNNKNLPEIGKDFLLTDAWKAKLFTNPNYSFGFFFINSENICNKHSEDLDYLWSNGMILKKVLKIQE